LKLFQYLENLKVLDLSHTPLTGKNFQLLPSSLQQLRCEECRKLTDDAIIGLAHCIHLRDFDLDAATVTKKYFNMLPKSTKIRGWF
jgi:hypothetical protein